MNQFFRIKRDSCYYFKLILWHGDYSHNGAWTCLKNFWLRHWYAPNKYVNYVKISSCFPNFDCYFHFQILFWKVCMLHKNMLQLSHLQNPPNPVSNTDRKVYFGQRFLFAVRLDVWLRTRSSRRRLAVVTSGCLWIPSIVLPFFEHNCKIVKIRERVLYKIPIILIRIY